MRRRVAKQRAQNNWQLDLKPVALTPPSERLAASNGHAANGQSASGNGAYPPSPPAPTPAVSSANPAVVKALDDLRAADNAVLKGLREIHSAINQLHSSITSLSGRVEAMEIQLASRPAPQPRASRPVRETSKTLRDSSTGPLQGRGRAGAAGGTEDATQ